MKKRNPESEASRKYAIKNRSSLVWIVSTTMYEGDVMVNAYQRSREGQLAARFSLKSTIAQRAPIKMKALRKAIQPRGKRK